MGKCHSKSNVLACLVNSDHGGIDWQALSKHTREHLTQHCELQDLSGGKRSKSTEPKYWWMALCADHSKNGKLSYALLRQAGETEDPRLLKNKTWHYLQVSQLPKPDQLDESDCVVCNGTRNLPKNPRLGQHSGDPSEIQNSKPPQKPKKRGAVQYWSLENKFELAMKLLKKFNEQNWKSTTFDLNFRFAHGSQVQMLQWNKMDGSNVEVVSGEFGTHSDKYKGIITAIPSTRNAKVGFLINVWRFLFKLYHNFEATDGNGELFVMGTHRFMKDASVEVKDFYRAMQEKFQRVWGVGMNWKGILGSRDPTRKKAQIVHKFCCHALYFFDRLARSANSQLGVSLCQAMATLHGEAFPKALGYESAIALMATKVQGWPAELQ